MGEVMKNKLVFYFIILVVLLTGCASNTDLKDVPLESGLEYEEFVPKSTDVQATDKSDILQKQWSLRLSEAIKNMDKVKETNITVDNDTKTITIDIEVLNNENLTEEEILSIKDLVQSSLEEEYEVVVSVI